MRKERRLTKVCNSMVVLGICAVLAAAVLFLYRTFEKTVRVDIFGYTKELEDSVRRTAGSEFRRFLLLMDVGRLIAEDESDKDLFSQTEDTSELFDHGGDFSNLVLSVGFYAKDIPETAHEYNLASGRWAEQTGLF